MISDVLADAIDRINHDLSNPNLTYLYTGKYLRIITVRNAMETLRQQLDAEWAEEDAARERERG